MAGNDVYLYSVPSDVDADDVRLRNPNEPATEAKSGSAPLSAVGVITAEGRKDAQAAAPVAAVGVVVAAGQKDAASAAPLSAAGVITATGQASGGGGVPVEPEGSTAGGPTAEDVERIRRFLKREKEPVTKLYKKLVRVKRYVPEEHKQQIAQVAQQYAKPDGKPFTLGWIDFPAVFRAADQARLAVMINNAIMAAEAAKADDDDDDDILLALAA